MGVPERIEKIGFLFPNLNFTNLKKIFSIHEIVKD